MIMTANNVNKCPACGTLRPAMATECPACGYEFTDSGASVLSGLSEMLDDLRQSASDMSEKEYEQQMVELIKTFHIPHIKEELLDVMMFIQPKAEEKTSVVSQAWRARQHEVFERAKLACANDTANLKMVLEYEQRIKRLEGQKARNLWIMLPSWAKFALAAALVILIVLVVPKKDRSPQAYSLRFVEAVENGNWDKAIEYLDECPEMGTSVSDHYLSLIDELISQDRLIEAENLFMGMTPFVALKESATHIMNTSYRFVRKFVADEKYDMALKYAADAEALEIIMRGYLENGQEETALKFFDRHSSKFYKYDYSLHRKVCLCKDEVILDFLKRKGINID